MAIFYRVHKKNDTKLVFSGDGGLHTAGRWNHKGKKIVYCSESIALATLEWLSHNGLSVSGFSYHKFSIIIPDEDILKFDISKLPKGWNSEPASNVTRDFSNTHLFKQNGPLAIVLPSVMVTEEFNLLINPNHSSFENVVKSVKHLGEHFAPDRN